MTCPSCASEVPEASRFCSTCGASIEGISSTPTRTSLRAGAPGEGRATAAPAARLSTSSGSLDEGRFIPGTMLAGRYRIIGLLGKGGMGEVYRADDLKLGQAVALKFLPEALAGDAVRLGRFLNEVKIARQVSHPNVCRVYDVGEVEGQHYLSMEFVDGEDLSSLLRRIGRLPTDKAVEVARQVCAGLAAAHDRGVLHRDLKPANVMIDGRGKVRLTDFGLAGLAGEFKGGDIRAGTPAYMSPEQLEGREVTARSDIYALGLVLYEMFTGKHIFQADTQAEMTRKRNDATAASLASQVKDLDPAVERVILRCLEKDPRLRPASAIAVAAALPGGDPLAAALAAGETPSPEMVAAAGEVGALRPRVAWALLVSILAGLAIFPLLSSKSTLLRKVPLEKPPEALEDEARNIAKRMGYDAPPTDRVSGFATDEAYQSYVEKNDPSSSRWDGLETGRPAIVYFWYRQSPRYLVPQTLGASGRPTLTDPPPDISGMVEVRLDPRGRLIEFAAVPPELDESKGPWPSLDWAALFEAGGLEIARFTPVGSTWVPPVFSDGRAAWEGVFPDRPGIRIRVEAGSYHGRPVSFRILGPWSAASRMVAVQGSLFATASSMIGAVMFVTVLTGSMMLAWRNLRLGRGDRNGAFRLAACFFSIGIVTWVLGSSHLPPLSGEADIFAINLAIGLLGAGGIWTVYMALEPLVRRHWPDMIISWSRLLAGRYRDPLVGRDILIGGLAGVARVVLDLLYHLAPGWFGLALQAFHPLTPETLRGARSFLPVLFGIAGFSIGTSLILCFLILLLRIVVRKQMLAAAVLTLVMTGAQATGAGNPLINLTYSGLGAAILIFTLTRFGLLALIVSTFLSTVLLQCPITLDASAWYAGAGLFGLLSVAALAAYGFTIALAGHPLLRGTLFEE